MWPGESIRFTKWSFSSEKKDKIVLYRRIALFISSCESCLLRVWCFLLFANSSKFIALRSHNCTFQCEAVARCQLRFPPRVTRTLLTKISAWKPWVFVFVGTTLAVRERQPAFSTEKLRCAFGASALLIGDCCFTFRVDQGYSTGLHGDAPQLFILTTIHVTQLKSKSNMKFRLCCLARCCLRFLPILSLERATREINWTEFYFAKQSCLLSRPSFHKLNKEHTTTSMDGEGKGLKRATTQSFRALVDKHKSRKSKIPSVVHVCMTFIFYRTTN